MVCQRCIMAVKNALKELSIPDATVELGEITTSEALSNSMQEALRDKLENLGFQILESPTEQLLEKIKVSITQLLEKEEFPESFLLSDFIQKNFHKDYSTISKTFSQKEGMTLEHFLISQKIEKVKELLFYGELTLSEIAFKVGYKSVQHLSSQFKTSTGLTPTAFRNLKSNQRKGMGHF